MHLDKKMPAVRLCPTVNRWLVVFRAVCLLGLVVTSVSIGLWTLLLGAALALSYRWSATRLTAAAAQQDAEERSRQLRNPLRGKPSAGTLADVSEQQLLDLREEVFAEVADGAEACDALKAFDPVRLGSACTFAKRARLWGAPDWRPNLSVESNAAACAPRLRLFCRVCGLLGLDGFVVRLPGDLCTEFNSFSGAVYGTLSGLSACEAPDRVDCMLEPEAVTRHGWVFRFHRQTFFVTTFAPFYGQEDSRFSYGAPDGFLLLQPELSFAQHDLPPDTPHTVWEPGEGKKTARDRVRCSFRDAGQSYRIRESVAYAMIEDIVMVPKALADQLQGIRWWEIGREIARRETH